ncbi:MAG: hypothetical protein JW839_14895 [Candidatus Lokiarchaeota archaeon]|nr:hypothetical protein [Candidatus Lokiarchaeota archaeon]
MLIQVPDGTPSIYWRSWNLVPNVVSIIVYIVIGLLLFKKKENEVDIYHKVKVGYGIFSIFYAMCRVFFILAIWFGVYYQLLTEIGYLWTTLGLEAILIVIENNLVKGTRHFFTIVGVIFIAILIAGILQLFPQDLARDLTGYVSPVLIALIVILYLYIAIKGAKDIRRNALLVILAVALIAVGAILDGEKLVISAGTWFPEQLMLEVFYSIPPAFLITGILVFYRVLK